MLERVAVDYFTLNEDLAMKTGPLLSPDLFREFILPHLKRLVAHFRDHGVPYVAVDSDGDPSLMAPLFMEAGVNVIWPLERAANVCPENK